MAKLVETNNVKMTGMRSFGGFEGIEVPAIGDGNCALNAFALGLIDLIKRDQLQLDAANKQRWLQAIQDHLDVCRQRLALYANVPDQIIGNVYEDLAPGLEAFINFIDTNPNSDQLFAYIREYAGDRLSVAALHVALAPSLRALGCDLYADQLLAIGADDHTQLEVLRLRKDGVSAGQEILAPLAQDFFHINLNIFDSTRAFALETAAEIPDAPVVTVLHVPGHWDFMLPADQKDGLAAEGVLDVVGAPAANLSVLLDQTASYVEFAKGKAEQFKKNANVIAEELPEVADVMKKSGNNLVQINQQAVYPKGQYQALAQEHLEQGQSILQSTREALELTKEKVKALGLHSELQQELVLGTKDFDPKSEDEILARTLQNAEILVFLSRSRDTLFGKKPAKIQPEHAKSFGLKKD